MNNTLPNQNTTSPAQASVKGVGNLLDALQLKGILTADAYKTVKFEAINTQKNIEDLLVEKGLVSFKDIARTYSEMRNIGFIDLSNIVIPVQTLNLIDQNTARDNLAVPFEDLGGKVKVGMKDPLDLQKIKYLESVTRKKIEAYYAAKDDLTKIIDTKYGAQIGSEVSAALEEVGDVNSIRLSQDYVDAESIESENAPIIKIVSMIMNYGVNNKASDIHIEPREKQISVRFRVRGVLAEKLTIPRKLLSAVVTRIKILSNLKIDEHRIPQDGRFQVKGDESAIDVRVSTMPSVFGEKVVMRLLEKSKNVLDIKSTGIRGMAFKKVEEALKKTQGIILVTGPTGSGKSTTLSTYLASLNSPQVNIITLEDPVEIKIDGVNQVQVNTEVGLTFASGLRAILRQDPDIIMVGEIRDAETAALAVQAALVGRLVLSTVHTNSAAGSFIRLIDMGIEPFLLSSTVNIVIAQRLVRTLSNAKKPYKAPPERIAKLHEELDSLNGIEIVRPDGTKVIFDKNTTDVTLYEPVSTPEADTGFIGRIGIFEVLEVSDTISAMVSKKSSIKEVHDQAVKEGMVTMSQDGFIKALEGVTTFEEVLRVRNE